MSLQLAAAVQAGGPSLSSSSSSRGRCFFPLNEGDVLTAIRAHGGCCRVLPPSLGKSKHTMCSKLKHIHESVNNHCFQRARERKRKGALRFEVRVFLCPGPRRRPSRQLCKCRPQVHQHPFIPQALTPHMGAARARGMGARPGRLEESAGTGRGGESEVRADQAAEPKSSLVSPYFHARWAGAVNDRDSCYVCPNNKTKSPGDALRICSFRTERSALFQCIAPALRHRVLGPRSAPCA